MDRLRLLTLLCLPGLFGQLLPRERDHQVVRIAQELLEYIRNPIMSLTQSMVQQQLDQCNRLETKMRAFDKQLSDLETREQESKIGFYTYQSIESTEAIQKFDRVLLNEGDAYNSTTGIFTCPTTGTYRFVWAIQIPNTDWGYLLVDLQVNGHVQGFTRTYGPKQHTSTNSVVTRLERGNRVWLQKREMANIRVGAYESSFSGNFLYH